MKKYLIVAVIFFTCSTILNAQEKIKLNTKKSTVTWEGSKLFGFGKHLSYFSDKYLSIIHHLHLSESL